MHVQDSAAIHLQANLVSVEKLLEYKFLSETKYQKEKEEEPEKKKRKLESTDNEKEKAFLSNKIKTLVELNCEINPSPIYDNLVKDLQKLMYKSMQTINSLKVAFQLKVPDMQDGNNFGVSVQEEVLSEVSKTEESIFVALEHILKYYTARAGICTNIVKSPLVVDYRKLLEENDRQFVYRLVVTVIDVRNSLMLVKDVVEKNKKKVLNPRGTQSYGAMY